MYVKNFDNLELVISSFIPFDHEAFGFINVFLFMRFMFLLAIVEHSRKLEDDIQNDTSGSLQNLLVSLCNAARDENPNVDGGRAKKDAQDIFEVGFLFGSQNYFIRNHLLQVQQEKD